MKSMSKKMTEINLDFDRAIQARYAFTVCAFTRSG
jgi:hypothetical protein